MNNTPKALPRNAFIAASTFGKAATHREQCLTLCSPDARTYKTDSNWLYVLDFDMDHSGLTLRAYCIDFTKGGEAPACKANGNTWEAI